MSKEVFFTSLALGRTFTREEWWAWCREHPGSREPVVELQGFQFNSCDVCLNPNRIGFGKPGWCVEIETAINLDGKWIASHDYSVHHSGGGSGVSLICKESFDTEKEAVFNIDSSEQSREHGGVFHIHKAEFTREETVQKLLDYFKTREFVPGYQCAVEPMTFIWTVFKVVKNKEDEK